MKMTWTAIVALGLAGLASADQKVDDAYKKAEDQIAKGRPEEAVKTVQKVVDQNPSSAEAHVALGRIQDKTGNSDAGTTTFAKAAALAGSAATPVRSQVLTAVALRDLELGLGKDALAHAEAAVSAEASPQALAALARAQVRGGDATKALETADKAVAVGATVAAAHMARGEALLALHKNADADAAIRKAIELDPKLIHAHVDLVKALIAEGKAADAVAEARKTSDANQDSGEAVTVLGTALMAQSPEDPKALNQAGLGMLLGKHDAEVLYAAGKIFESSNPGQAEILYRAAVAIDPGFVPAQTALIDVQVRKGELDGALKAATELAKQLPQSGDAQMQLGRILLRKADFAGAVPVLENTVKLAPGLAEAYASLGTAYQFNGRTPDAVTSYKKAVELAPENLDYRTTYGLLLGLVGQADEGAAELKKVVASPGYKNPAGFMNLGRVYLNMKPAKTEESIAAYKKAMELDPKNEQAALGLAWAYSYSRRWRESIAAFNHAVEIDKKVAGEAYNGIAWCYYFDRKMDEAQSYAEKAAAEGRTDARLKEHIAKIKSLMASNSAAAEKAITETEGPKREQGPDIGTVVNNLRNQNAGVAGKAATDMRAFGREGVPYLASYGMAHPDIRVREATVASIAALGGAACEALPTLKRIAVAPPPVPGIDAKKEEIAAALREGDLTRTIKQTIEAIQPKCH